MKKWVWSSLITQHVIRRLLICLLLGVSDVAMAWDGTVTGALGQIDITDGNYAFRAYLSAPQSMCGNANDWVYLNASDSNYSAYVASILMARSQGTVVTFFANRDAQGYCHVGYLMVRYP